MIIALIFLSAIVGIVALMMALEYGDTAPIVVFVICAIICGASIGISNKVISRTDTVIPAPSIIKTPTAVIVEVRFEDKIERRTFTDIDTYTRAKPDSKVIYRVTKDSWNERGEIMLVLP